MNDELHLTYLIKQRITDENILFLKQIYTYDGSRCN
jgi:hypothetical protein